jgi:hypothetical protein
MEFSYASETSTFVSKEEHQLKLLPKNGGAESEANCGKNCFKMSFFHLKVSC